MRVNSFASGPKATGLVLLAGRGSREHSQPVPCLLCFPATNAYSVSELLIGPRLVGLAVIGADAGCRPHQLADQRGCNRIQLELTSQADNGFAESCGSFAQIIYALFFPGPDVASLARLVSRSLLAIGQLPRRPSVRRPLVIGPWSFPVFHSSPPMRIRTAIIARRMSFHVCGFIITALGNMQPSQQMWRNVLVTLAGPRRASSIRRTE